MIRNYTLIDGAMVYDTLCASPLFTDSTLSWYIALLPGKQRRLVGPILIDRDLLEVEDAATKQAVEEVLNSFPGRLHASELQSEKDLTALARHLQRFSCVYGENFLLMAFRFADTRILVHLPHILSPHQWAEMTTFIHQWTCFDRRGEAVVLVLPDDRISIISENQQLTLSAKQISLFNDLSEPDTLLNILNYTPQMMENCLYDYWHLALQCVKTWQQSGSEDREVLRQFAIKVFHSNGKALQEQDWETLLSEATPQDIQCLN